MNISIGPETEKLLEKRLKTGEFASADAVVRAALEALDRVLAEGLDEKTLDAIDEAEDQVDRGEIHEWKDVREKVRARFSGK